MPFGIAAALFAAPVALGDPLLGVGGDSVNVQADSLDVEVSSGTAVLTGNVSFSKGDFT